MNLLTAPTSLGNRPYEDDGTARCTDRGPARLREQGIVERLNANDLGDVPAAPYRDFARVPSTIRNEDLVLAHVRAIARALERIDGFTLILGGDCSVLLGSLLGLSKDRDLGLVFIDGHDDFNTIDTTVTGAVAGMDLALATGRGTSELARLRGARPLVRDEHVVAVGIREWTNARAHIRTAVNAEEAIDKIGGRDFFIHLDADVLDPEFMPFVDSPVAGGLTPDALIELLVPLVRHPRAVGMELTIYDPRHDYDSRGAALLADILDSTFRGFRTDRRERASLAAMV
jgi:arginase